MAGAVGRFFLAAPLPQSLKNYLAQLQQTVRSQLSQPLRWVKPEGMHLTLKFIGDFERARLKELEEALSAWTGWQTDLVACSHQTWSFS